MYVAVDFGVSLGLPFIVFAIASVMWRTSEAVNPAIVNGVLTITAIVFGFVTFELREIKASMNEKFMLFYPLLGFMFLTILVILASVLIDGTNFPIVAFLDVTANCLFNVFYIFPVLIAKEHWNQNIS